MGWGRGGVRWERYLAKKWYEVDREEKRWGRWRKGGDGGGCANRT